VFRVPEFRLGRAKVFPEASRNSGFIQEHHDTPGSVFIASTSIF